MHTATSSSNPYTSASKVKPTGKEKMIVNAEEESLANSLIISSILRERTPVVESEGDLLDRSFGNPIFNRLIEDIQAGRVSVAKSALDTISKPGANKVALSYALIMALECGCAAIIGKLAKHIWAENALPESLLYMQNQENASKPWKGPNRDVIYKELIKILADKEGLTLEDKSKEKLQTAVTHMVNQSEEHVQTLLDNPCIVEKLNLEALLLTAIVKGNCVAAITLVEKGSKNLTEALVNLQTYIIPQTRYSTTRYWNGPNRDAIYAKIVGILATKTEFTTEEKSRDNMQKALLDMLAQWDEFAEVLLGNPEIVKTLDLEALLLAAITAGNSTAAIVLVEKGSKNISDALVKVQTYIGFQRHKGWKNGGYEEVRLKLVQAIASRSDLTLISDKIKERENLRKIISKIVYTKEKSRSQFKVRFSELRTLLLSSKAVLEELDLDALLMDALKIWHGEAAVLVAQVGGKTVPSALAWLQQNYSPSGSFIEGYVAKTWKSGSWAETYRSLTHVAAGNWQEVYNDVERSSETYAKVTRQEVRLEITEQTALLLALQYMITNGQEEALILLRALYKSGLMLNNLIESLCNSLLRDAIKGGNGLAAKLIIDRKEYNQAVAEGNILVAHLELLVFLSQTTTWKPGCPYPELRDHLSDVLIMVGVKCETEEQLGSLLQLLKTVIQKGEIELLKKLIRCESIKNNIDNFQGLELIKIALKAGEKEIVQYLIEGEIDSPVLLGIRLKAIFDFSMHEEEIAKEQPAGKKIDPKFYRELTLDTLRDPKIFEFFSDKESAELYKVMGFLINKRDGELINIVNLKHINPKLDYEKMLKCAVESCNFPMVQVFTDLNMMSRINRLTLLKMIQLSQEKTTNTTDENLQQEHKEIRNYLLQLFERPSIYQNLGKDDNEKDALMSLFGDFIFLGETRLLEDLFRRCEFISTQDIALLLGNAINLVAKVGSEDNFKKFEAMPFLIARVPRKVVEVLEKMQALPPTVKQRYDHIYCGLITKLLNNVGMLALNGTETERDRLIKVIKEMLASDLDKKEDHILAILRNPTIRAYLGAKVAELLPKLQEPGREKFLIVLVCHATEEQLGLTRWQTKQAILAPVFLEAARSNRDDLVNLFLISTPDKAYLGLKDKGSLSPLVVALEKSALKVLSILLSLDNFTEMDCKAASELEFSRRKQNKDSKSVLGFSLTWSTSQPELPDDLLQKLMRFESVPELGGDRVERKDLNILLPGEVQLQGDSNPDQVGECSSISPAGHFRRRSAELVINTDHPRSNN